MSVDRFADKYPGMSPYTYVANNPVIFTDPTGDTIRVPTSYGDLNDSGGNAIVSGKGDVVLGNGWTSVDYEPGMGMDGGTGGTGDIMKALDFISDNAKDGGGICDLVSSSEVVTIMPFRYTEKGKNNFHQFNDNLDGKGGSYLMFHPNQGLVFRYFTGSAIAGEQGYRSPVEGMNHELGHALSFIDNLNKYFRDHGTNMKYYHNKEEFNAVQRENNFAKRLFGNKAVIRNHHMGTFVPAR